MLVGLLLRQDRLFQHLSRDHNIQRIIDPSLDVLLLQSFHSSPGLLKPKDYTVLEIAAEQPLHSCCDFPMRGAVLAEDDSEQQ